MIEDLMQNDILKKIDIRIFDKRREMVEALSIRYGICKAMPALHIGNFSKKKRRVEFFPPP